MGRKRTRSGKKNAGSAIEYLTTYSWMVLIVAIVFAIFYIYLSLPSQVVNNTCNFVSGAYCNDVIITSNMITHKTAVSFFLTNSQQSPLKNPQLYVRVNNANTTVFPCSPNFVLVGGSIICTANLTVNTTTDAFVSGGVYLTGNYCTASYTSTHNCTNTVTQTYVGTFAGHTQPFRSPASSLVLTATNYTQAANNNTDQLSAVVYLSGYPLKSATVNFTVNQTGYPIVPSLTTTNFQGLALSGISAAKSGLVKVTASYAGVSNSILINFSAPETIRFDPQTFNFCATSGVVLIVDGVSYTCTNLLTKQFGYSKGSVHSYTFEDPDVINSSTRESFTNVIISGAPSKNPTGSIIANSNMTIPFNYNVQYYLTEMTSPNGAGNIVPGPNWINGTNTITLTESPNTGWVFDSWSCTGTGCYSGASTSAILTINSPITETADYHMAGATTVPTTVATTVATTTTNVPTTTVNGITTIATTVATTVPTTVATTTICTLATCSSQEVELNISPAGATNNAGVCFEYQSYWNGSYYTYCASDNIPGLGQYPVPFYVTVPTRSGITDVCESVTGSYAFSGWSGDYSGPACMGYSSATAPVVNGFYVIQADYVPTANYQVTYTDYSVATAGPGGTIAGYETYTYSFASGSSVDLDSYINCPQFVPTTYNYSATATYPYSGWNNQGGYYEAPGGNSYGDFAGSYSTSLLVTVESNIQVNYHCPGAGNPSYTLGIGNGGSTGLDISPVGAIGGVYGGNGATAISVSATGGTSDQCPIASTLDIYADLTPVTSSSGDTFIIGSGGSDTGPVYIDSLYGFGGTAIDVYSYADGSVSFTGVCDPPGPPGN